MNKQAIADEIIKRVEASKTVNYSSWRIGLTHDPQQRAQEHKNSDEDIQYWMQWQANSLSDAQDIESYFINTKKMQGGTGGNLSSSKITYVYII